MVAVAGHSMLLLALVALMGAGVVLMVDGRTVLVRVGEPEGLLDGRGGADVVREKRAGANLPFDGASHTYAEVDGELTPITNYRYAQTRPGTTRQVIGFNLRPILTGFDIGGLPI